MGDHYSLSPTGTLVSICQSKQLVVLAVADCSIVCRHDWPWLSFRMCTVHWARSAEMLCVTNRLLGAQDEQSKCVLLASTVFGLSAAEQMVGQAPQIIGWSRQGLLCTGDRRLRCVLVAATPLQLALGGSKVMRFGEPYRPCGNFGLSFSPDNCWAMTVCACNQSYCHLEVQVLSCRTGLAAASWILGQNIQNPAIELSWPTASGRCLACRVLGKFGSADTTYLLTWQEPPDWYD